MTLIDKHSLKRVHIEGYCIGQEEVFERIIGEWTSADQRLEFLKIDVANIDGNELAKPLAGIIHDVECELDSLTTQNGRRHRLVKLNAWQNLWTRSLHGRCDPRAPQFWCCGTAVPECVSA